ncbi:MAG: hypothetical protein JWM27_2426 [Gemmatimonadetes bacterium]|nr:hypothetical protein [Gemmatimonadota bacterium]
MSTIHFTATQGGALTATANLLRGTADQVEVTCSVRDPKDWLTVSYVIGSTPTPIGTSFHFTDTLKLNLVAKLAVPAEAPLSIDCHGSHGEQRLYQMTLLKSETNTPTDTTAAARLRLYKETVSRYETLLFQASIFIGSLLLLGGFSVGVLLMLWLSQRSPPINAKSDLDGEPVRNEQKQAVVSEPPAQGGASAGPHAPTGTVMKQDEMPRSATSDEGLAGGIVGSVDGVDGPAGAGDAESIESPYTSKVESQDAEWGTNVISLLTNIEQKIDQTALQPPPALPPTGEGPAPMDESRLRLVLKDVIGEMVATLEVRLGHGAPFPSHAVPVAGTTDPLKPLVDRISNSLARPEARTELEARLKAFQDGVAAIKTAVEGVWVRLARQDEGRKSGETVLFQLNTLEARAKVARATLKTHSAWSVTTNVMPPDAEGEPSAERIEAALAREAAALTDGRLVLADELEQLFRSPTFVAFGDAAAKARLADAPDPLAPLATVGGVVAFGISDAKFDPKRHLDVDGNGRGEIVRVLAPGYEMGGTVLFKAVVKAG